MTTATTTTERIWTSYTACAAVEGFDGEEHDEDTLISAWQYLIDTKQAWSLQGWYGRTAADLIDAGYCTLPGAEVE